MVPIMGRRFTAVLISLVVFTCQWLMPAPAHAAMDVAKQVLIGADYSNKDLRGATFNLSNLREANLSGSDLRGASPYGAQLQFQLRSTNRHPCPSSCCKACCSAQPPLY